MSYQVRAALYVDPDPVPPLTEEELARVSQEFSFGGCAGLSFLVFLLLIMVAAPFEDSLYRLFNTTSRSEATEAFTSIGTVLSVAVAALFLLIRNASRSSRNAEALLEQKGRQYQVIADQVAEDAKGRLRNAIEGLENLPRLLDGARNELILAGREFEERAYSSFWDAIDSCASNLREYCRQVESLKSGRDKYEKELAGKRHNFPPFPLKTIQLPNPAPLLAELRSKARQGDTDPHFAAILEHKKTRGVLLEGFKAVTSAIQSLEGNLGNSLGELHGTLGTTGQGLRHQIAGFQTSFEEYSREHLKLLR